jgi:sialate O-acetylesterase
MVAPETPGALRLPAIFADHMVLQKGPLTSLWGWDDPGQRVVVQIPGAADTSALADRKSGRWKITLPPLPAGGPHKITFKGSREVVIHDVLIGEVWLCAGQSNMAWPLAECTDAAGAVAAMDHPQLRCFIVTPEAAGHPQEDFKGYWQICTAEAAAKLSGVAYFFGRELLQTLGVPLGLIQAAWGGSPIEAWMDFATLSNGTGHDALPPRGEEQVACILRDVNEERRVLAEWQAKRDRMFSILSCAEIHWAHVAFDDSDWLPCPVPGHFDDAVGGLDGTVWYRRAIDVPPAWAGQDLLLNLGVIDDLDHTFWNGAQIGSTGPDTPQCHQHVRRYRIPGHLVYPGSNLLAVRVMDEYLAGGFLSMEEDLWLAPADASGTARIRLAGTWRVRAGQRLRPRPMLPGMPQTLATGAFNAMIAPLIGLNLRGVIWYQGENNIGNAERYRDLFPALIRSWSGRWNLGDFPFLFVQLANHGPRRTSPAGSALAALREAQAAALSLPATAMVTAIDLGEADDIHPRNKRDVGVRLAAAFFNLGANPARIVGPPTRVPEGVRIAMALPLVTKDGEPPASFEFTTADRRRHAAGARLEADAIVVECPPEAPVIEVRHAWADNPDVNVIEKGSGLPLLPFRMPVADPGQCGEFSTRRKTIARSEGAL